MICHKPRGSIRYEIDLDVKDCNVAEVRHNGKSLCVESDRYRLSDYSGRLEIIYESEPPEIVSLFDGSSLLIFKLGSEWEDPGYRQKRINTNGYFLVFVPRDWPQNGNPPIAPVNCGDENFQAHFLVHKGDDSYARDTIILIGESVYDDSDQGPLFIDEIPTLEVPPNITWVRAGEEYPGSWKGENFKPNDKTLEEILDGRQGHFFIRVFDAVRLDSAEFRYLRDLRKILVDGKPYTKDTILLPTAHKKVLTDQITIR